MTHTFPRSLEEIKLHLKDPLYKNSFYILLTLIMGSIFGFFFWIVAAKIYPQDYVGLNTALISAVNLLAILSFLGLDQSIIRFFPHGERLKILITSTIIITIFSILFGVIFVLGIDIWSPQLAVVKNNLLAFFISLVAFSLTTPLANAFIALRKSRYYFYQNILMGTRVFLVLLPFFGKFGIFISFGISSIIAVLFSIYFMYKIKVRKVKIKEYFQINKEFIVDSFHFSAGNYFFVLLITIPGYILPIIVLNVLGSTQTAYYFIAYTVASILFMIPAAFSTSLFVEGSHGESIRKNTIKSAIAIFSILTPLAVILFLFGGYLLGLIGSSYVEGFPLLQTLIISSFFYGICQIYFSVSKIQKSTKDLIIISLLIFILLIGLSYPLMSQFGILGVGYSWIISYLMASIYAIFKIIKLK